MKNYVQHGDTLSLTAPAGGVVSGSPYLIGAIFGVAAHNAVEGDPFELRRKGVVTLPKKTGEAWSEGSVLYFDPATGNLTTTAGSLKKVALAVVAAASADVVGSAVILPAAT